jgi:hypothetical protein
MFIIKNCYQIYDNTKKDSSPNDANKSDIYIHKNKIKLNQSSNNFSHVIINPKSEIEIENVNVNFNVNQSNFKRVDLKFQFYEMMLSIMFI